MGNSFGQLPSGISGTGPIEGPPALKGGAGGTPGTTGGGVGGELGVEGVGDGAGVGDGEGLGEGVGGLGVVFGWLPAVEAFPPLVALPPLGVAPFVVLPLVEVVLLPCFSTPAEETNHSNVAAKVTASNIPSTRASEYLITPPPKTAQRYSNKEGENNHTYFK
jgi:hypothetical protein